MQVKVVVVVVCLFVCLFVCLLSVPGVQIVGNGAKNSK